MGWSVGVCGMSRCVAWAGVGRAPRATLFPYTTLFRSRVSGAERRADGEAVDQVGVGDERSSEADSAGNSLGHRSEEHTSELQSRRELVCRLLLEKKKITRCPGPRTPTP